MTNIRYRLIDLLDWFAYRNIPIALPAAVCIFLIAGAISFVGRHTSAATSATPLPIILIATPAVHSGRAPEANVQGAQLEQPIIVPTAPPIVEQPAAAPPQVEAVPTPEPVATAPVTAADAWSSSSVPNSEAPPARTVVPDPPTEPNAKSFLQDAPPAPPPSGGALGNG